MIVAVPIDTFEGNVDYVKEDTNVLQVPYCPFCNEPLQKLSGNFICLDCGFSTSMKETIYG